MDALIDLARRGLAPRLPPARSHADAGPAPQDLAPPRSSAAGRDTSSRPHTRATAVAGPAGRLDPRLYQIAVLAGLLAYGVTVLRFEVTPAQALLTLAAALATQALCTRLAGLRACDPRSALISGLSLCLLLRTSEPALAVLAAALAIASKFVVRWRGKHFFNPTNIALVGMTLLTGGNPARPGAVWVSPGQWGSVAFFAFLMACLGGLVVNRAARSDVTFAFLAAYLGILFARAAWLGQRPAVPLHQLENGAFLLFTFFMISDPRTTPDSRPGRVLFATLVAAGAAFQQFVLYRPNGLLWSLAACSLAVPLIDRWLPGPRYQWKPTAATAGAPTSGDPDETHVPAAGAAGAVALGRP